MEPREGEQLRALRAEDASLLGRANQTSTKGDEKAP